MNSKNTLILEPSPQRLKLCLVQSSARISVRSLQVFEPGRAVTAGDIATLLATLQYERLLICLPRSSFIIRFLELPAPDVQEIARMLPFQLAKSAPFSLDEALYDFVRLGSERGRAQVFAFLLPVKKIAALLEFIRESNVAPVGFALSSEGLARWAGRQDKTAAAKNLLVVDIDGDCADFTVVSQGRLVFSRSFGAASDQDISAGIEQSLGIYRKQFGQKEFAKTIFTGRANRDVADRINFSDTRFIDNFAGYAVENNVRESIEEQAVSFASLLGLVGRPVPQLDFSPSFVKQGKAGGKLKRRYLDAAVVLGQVAIIAGLLFARGVIDEYRRLRFLDSQLGQITIAAKDLDQIADKLKVLDKNNTSSFSQVLYQLVAALPPGSQLTFVDFQDNGKFSLKGYVPDASGAFKMVTAFNDSALFGEVKVKYVSSVKQQGIAKAEFYIYGEKK
jgi:Tfp pilus assembly protein PilN